MKLARFPNKKMKPRYNSFQSLTLKIFMRKAVIKIEDQVAGWLTQDEHGYHFAYDSMYVNSSNAKPVSLTLPLTKNTYTSNVLFPFFDGLIPEGWLLDIAQKNWKLNPRDRMELLLLCCKDCIGSVSIEEIKEEMKS
jgi:serine/threonine-protein kinase HipA